MGLSTKEKKEEVVSKRQKVEKLKEKHLEIFEQEKIKKPKFIPRMAYKHNGELIVSFYPSEVEGKVDIYTEFVSREYEPEDLERRLWKWIYNDAYNEEYAQSDPHPSTGDKRYLIPVDELIEVKLKIEPESEEKSEPLQLFDALPDAESDLPYSSMTIRDYAAIKWKLAVSHKAWLNNLINDLEENKPF